MLPPERVVKRAHVTQGVRASVADILEVSNVSKTYDLGGPRPVTALDGVSINVRKGEFVSVIGPSGCGKSTLFGIIGGLVDGHSGSVRIDGVEVSGSHKDVGIVFQEESTFPWRTTIQNVAFPLEVQGKSKAEREERAKHFIRLVGLDGFENHYPAQLSGGMKQRTAVARTLAYEPKIMLLDEPFGALDEQTRLLLGDKLLEIWSKLNQTMLLITHNITEAVQLSDRVLVMSYRPGKIKRVIDIKLPRPRSSEQLSTAEFGKYVGEIWNELRIEATRGMMDAEKAIAAR
jgi:NitT/TauT family transport system ATP-binding protein